MASRPFMFRLFFQKFYIQLSSLLSTTNIERGSWLRCKIFSKFMYAENVVYQTNARTWKEVWTFNILYRCETGIQGRFVLWIGDVVMLLPPPFTFVSRVTVKQGAGASCTGIYFEFQLHPLLPLQPWASHLMSLNSILYMQNGGNLRLLWELNKIKCVLVSAAGRKLIHTCFFPAAWFLWAVSMRLRRKHHLPPSFSLSLSRHLNCACQEKWHLGAWIFIEEGSTAPFTCIVFRSFLSWMLWLPVAHLKVQCL